MKLRYVFFAVILIVVSGLFAFAGNDGAKNDFFSAESLLDANDLNLFEGAFSRDKITKYDFEVKDGSFELAYTLYTEDFETYFVESKDNFDFVIKCDKNVSELNIPWDLIEYFNNCKSYNKKYSSFYDEIFDVLKKNTKDDDFSSRTSIVNYNGLKRQNNSITLELKDFSVVVKAFENFFSSEKIVEMLNEIYGAECTSAQLGAMIGDTVNNENTSLLYKRDIVSDTAHEEAITLSTSGNILNIKIKNVVTKGSQKGSITASDTKNNVNFALSLAKNDESESIVVQSGDVYSRIEAKDKKSITYFSENGNTRIKMTISTLPDKSFGDSIYDTGISSQKNLMLCEISPWLYANGNAAILFKTYEVDLKPLKINLEDLKINFDE